MNDPLNWAALGITILFGLPSAIYGYKKLFKCKKKPKGDASRFRTGEIFTPQVRNATRQRLRASHDKLSIE